MLKKNGQKVVDLMLRKKFTRLVGILFSIRTSMADGRLTVIRWDGQDWEYRWTNGRTFYAGAPNARPGVMEKGEQFFFSYYKPQFGDVVVDVGAGAGMEVLFLSDAVGPLGRVIAIEADPSALRRLGKQVAHLANQNIDIVPMAVAGYEGTIDFFFSEGGHVGNSITANAFGESQLSVRCSTLHSIFTGLGLTKVSYMKMNIEGAEYEALLSLHDLIRCVDNLCISCHDFTGVPQQRTHAEVLRLIKGQGFRTYASNSSTPWKKYYIFARREILTT